MLDFLEGFSYGLFLSCFPWFVTGLLRPRLAVPTDPPRRWQVVVRYWFAFPFLAFVLWLTSFWGDGGATLGGWLAGLAAIAVEIPLERRWHRWRAARARQRLEAARAAVRAAQERERRESGIVELDPVTPPADADDVVRALWGAKRRLLDVGLAEAAVQADRLYGRYVHVLNVLRSKFDERELAFDRSRGLVAEVCFTAVDNFAAMVSLAQGAAGVDGAFVRRKLEREGPSLAAEERAALQRRLDLLRETERRMKGLTARNEAAMTALDEAAVTIAAIETRKGRASVSASMALEDLRRFVDKVELYSRSA